MARDLQAMVGYTFNTSKFLNDPTNQGQVFSTWTPKHMLRAWLSYQLPGDWNRLSVGAGVTALFAAILRRGRGFFLGLGHAV